MELARSPRAAGPQGGLSVWEPPCFARPGSQSGGGTRGPTNHHPSPLRTHNALEITRPEITAFLAAAGPAPALSASPGAGVRGPMC